LKLKTLDLFAGAGGFTLSGEMAGGYETVAFCEIDPYARKVLAKNWPDVPIFEDVTKLHARDVDGTIDVITGGFPCQDLSAAGRGAGLGAGTRSGLFREMLRLADEIREKQGRLPYIIFENVPRLLSGPTETPGEWFGEFLGALAEVGYDAEWFCITAASIGAPHERERVCVVAYANETPIERGRISRGVYAKHATIDSSDSWWREGFSERRFYRMDDGVPKGSHARRNGLMGNAIVPQVFAIVMCALYEAHMEAQS
jgi:DNA (cytosine-5)-methyltransferase 1